MRSLAVPLVLLAASLGAPIAHAQLVLDNGSLTVTIREDNGAIGQVLFGGSDFYTPADQAPTWISDWGIQTGGDFTSFVCNQTRGGYSQLVNVLAVGDGVMVSGSYLADASPVDFTRTYSLVPGHDVLRTEIELTNNGAGPVTVRLFDTFVPRQGVDQGAGEATSNDVAVLATPDGDATVAVVSSLAADPLTVVIGSLDPAAVVGSGGFPFAISRGEFLNEFLAAPFDGDGAPSEYGTHVAVQIPLAAGATERFVLDQAYGADPDAARDEFVMANDAAYHHGLGGGASDGGSGGAGGGGTSLGACGLGFELALLLPALAAARRRRRHGRSPAAAGGAARLG